MATRLTFDEAKEKYGFKAKRTRDYSVVDEFDIDITNHVKVMSMAGGLYVIDEFGFDITSRVKIEK